MTGKLAIGAAAGVVVLGVLWWLKGSAGAAASAVGDALAGVGSAVNPLNRDNVFYSATNDVGAAITGDESFSLGAWIWEATHPELVAAERAVTGSGATGTW